jgi:hypothetical protein
MQKKENLCLIGFFASCKTDQPAWFVHTKKWPLTRTGHGYPLLTSPPHLCSREQTTSPCPLPPPILHSSHLRPRSQPALSLKLLLGVPVVLGRVDTVVRVVDKVEPRHDVQPDTGVSALATGNALHVLSQGALAVERHALLDAVRHLAHVHLDLAPVLGPAVEAVLAARVHEQEAGGEGNEAREAHDRSEAALADF